ncbi:MAG: hypothetical protein H6707_17760 [Deltaproteobacteria bacterium]|nr:hypothetical protein [Deltaproteobacteria bacterium]
MAKRIFARRPIPVPQVFEPTDEELVALAEGKLCGTQRELVEALVRASPYSSQRLEILRELIGAVEDTESRPGSESHPGCDADPVLVEFRSRR